LQATENEPAPRPLLVIQGTRRIIKSLMLEMGIEFKS
jgi:hypothetical protein